MKEEHLEDVLRLLKEFNVRFNVYKNYDIETLRNELLNNENVSSYVIFSDDNHKKVIDFVSYVNIKYIKCSSFESINARNFYLHSCVNITTDDLMKYSLELAKIDNIDILNTTDVMLMSDIIMCKEYDTTEDSDNDENGKTYDYKFIKSGKKMHLNFFNWKCPQMRPIQISLFWFNF
jgi:hypothetical protein